MNQKMMFQLARLATLALVLVASTALSKNVSEEDRTIVQVFDAPGYTQAQIHTAAQVWIAENFRSGKAVIEYDNKDEGAIIGNGRINYPCTGAFSCMAKGEWRVPFTMKLEAKDGRFRLTFTNIHLYWPASFASGIRTPENDSPVYQQKDMDLIRPKLLEFGPEIQKALATAKAADNW